MIDKEIAELAIDHGYLLIPEEILLEISDEDIIKALSKSIISYRDLPPSRITRNIDQFVADIILDEMNQGYMIHGISYYELLHRLNNWDYDNQCWK